MLGDWLENSGWTTALTNAEIATAGVADSFIKANSVSRTRHAHQVTACSLHCLLKNAYSEYCTSMNSDELLGYDEWMKQKSQDSAQFQFWTITLDLELKVLIFVRSIRSRNFRLYIESLKSLLPWFFALDHTNYARWLPVHVRDLEELQSSTQTAFAEEVKSLVNAIEDMGNPFTEQSPDLLQLDTKDIAGKEVVNTRTNTERIAPCTHEEADTRSILHMKDISENNLQRILVRTVDTDVVILALSVYHKLNIEELWIAFGVGRNYHYIPVHTIAAILGIERVEALPAFHAFTGCDQVSFFYSKGKKTAWDTCISFPE
ncbi:hypothetical protein MAR_025782, partial [Mya arenaria]